MAVSGENPAWRSGQDNIAAKLRDNEVRAARELRHDYRLTVVELARMYGTSHGCMSLLLRGITYADAGGPLDPGRPRRPHKRA